jgi:ribose 5-phosphate isomerase B
VKDLGAYKLDATDDYPDFALRVASAVQSGDVDRGIVICGSGIGATIVANKVQGVRAATCHDTYSARQGVEHDDVNVLCLGARVVGFEVAKEVLLSFMRATFSGEERHVRRLEKIQALDLR